MLNSKRRWPTLRGWPALGCALTGSVAYWTRLSTTASIRWGPMVQLVPSMAIGKSPSTEATSCGVSPPRVRSSSAKVACATMGTSQMSLATATASASSSR